MTEEDKCPVSPTCKEFALYLDEQGYRDRYAEYTREIFETRVFEWALKHKDKSTATLNHILAKDVPILHHAMERIDVMDIKNLNLAMAQYYETLDDYTKMEAGIAFGLMQITVKQTARVFYTELEGVVSAFEEMGCPLTQQIQKHIYLHTCYELYPEKLEKATQGWVFNSNMDLPGVRVEVEKILINDNIDSSFSTEFTTDLEKRANRVDRVQKFRQLGIICNKVDTKFYGKKEEEKVMSAFHAQSQVNLNKACQNQRCTKKGVKNHTARRCRFNEDEQMKDANTEPPSKKLHQAYEINPSGTKTWEKAKDEVYNALAKDFQVTDKELKASTDLIEELALFSLTKAQGAKKRFLNKIRKQLHPINSKNDQFTKYSSFNNNNNTINNK
jgi:hypothetical protein